MPHADFVHLRVHSAYSLSEGAIKVDKIPALAHAAGMPAVAITDSGNLFGALEFSQACVARAVQPIIGCQIGLSRGPRLPPDPLIVLAQSASGLANVTRLSSRGFLETEAGNKPQMSLDVLAEHAAGLMLLTGGTTGPVARLLAEGQRGEAESLLAKLSAAFPGRVAVELHRHGLAVERAIEPGLLALADAAGLPIVAANDCMFASPDMHAAHDALLCIAEGRVLSEADRRRVTPEHWFKPAADMRVLFADLPEACDNTLAIARSCAVMVEARKPLLPVSPKVRPGATEAETVREMAAEGLSRRMADRDASSAAQYRERLHFELGVIEAMGFAGYFLIVADFIGWAKRQDIPVGPGRGSGAGSVAAWALGITDIDPIRFGLLFERFLNPERVSMPDFDIDFCQDRRDEVIDYVRREYGADRVAQIITFGKLQARAAVRDVGRVLGLPYGQVNKVAELIPNNPAKPVTLKQAVDGEPRLQQMRDEDEGLRRLLEIALQLEGLYRHASTHAAGVVIGDRPLGELVPLYRDPKSDFLVTQYSMKHVEQAGLVKFDFLGLTTLTILRRCIVFLAEMGVEVDLARIPLDDARVYEMLTRGDVGGVFQFEGQGMRDMLRQMRPDRFEDLIAGVAMYRPGPMASIPEFCRRKHEGSEPAPHPSIDPVLAPTYGIIVYQEQVMEIARIMGAYTLGGADLLRRAMGKKIRSEMEAQRETFLKGAAARGIGHEKAVEVFELMAKFADYGFNKCHAAPYALISYQTAFMRCNHPVPFMAACMSLAIGNTDRLGALRQECERMGVRVLPPDIRKSHADFRVETQPDGTHAIRYALAAIKKVGAAAMNALVQVREQSQFADMADFAARVDPRAINRAQIENLARAGAFDSIEPNRARVFAGAETILRRAQSEAGQKGSGQIGLFSGRNEPEHLRLPDVPDWAPMERLGYEAEAIGFHLTAHPLDAYARVLRRMDVIPSTALETRASNGTTRGRIAGIVLSEKQRTTRSGSRMAWVKITDVAGSVEVTLFSEVLARAQGLLTPGSAVLVTVDLRTEGETLRITASDIASLDEAAANAGAGIRVWLDGADAVSPLRTLLAGHRKGRGRVILIPRLDETRTLEIALPGGFSVTPALAQTIKALTGVTQVEDL